MPARGPVAGSEADGNRTMRTRRLMYVLPVIAAALAVSAFMPAASSAAGPAPLRARITGAVIPGSGAEEAPAAAPAGLPSKQQQIKVLTAVLAKISKDYKSLPSSPGVADIDDYGIGSLWRQGIDGAGTTIAVIEGWDLSGIGSIVAGYDKLLGLPNPQIQTIFPAGRLPAKCPPGMVKLGGYGSCDAWGGELALDVLTAHLIAPYAKILISATPADTQITDDAASQVAPPEMMKALELISQKHLANVISISDGTGETTYSHGSAEILAQDPGELAAAAAGIPVLVATGDCGVVQNLAVANGQCEDTSGTPDTAAWDDSPWVTAVGGSLPNFSPTGKRRGPDPLWNVAGLFSEGAGFSSVYSRPAYQNGAAGSTGGPMRSVPDITMDAADGTSEAAPMLAGVLALATQLNGGNVGPINPALYDVLGPAGAKDGIADVVSGNDSVVKNGTVTVPGFAAGPGFDVASGWGTVDAPTFVPSLVAATRAAGQDGSVRQQAAAELAALARGSIQLTPTSSGNSYLLAGGFLPGHPVRVYINGKSIATLTANPLGDVTSMISPARLHLAAGQHVVVLGSMLINETASFFVR
jgi:subtilase family serine protease